MPTSTSLIISLSVGSIGQHVNRIAICKPCSFSQFAFVGCRYKISTQVLDRSSLQQPSQKQVLLQPIDLCPWTKASPSGEHPERCTNRLLRMLLTLILSDICSGPTPMYCSSTIGRLGFDPQRWPKINPLNRWAA